MKKFAILSLQLAPLDPQLGRIALNRTITKEQWDTIMAVLGEDKPDGFWSRVRSWKNNA